MADALRDLLREVLELVEETAHGEGEVIGVGGMGGSNKERSWAMRWSSSNM